MLLTDNARYIGYDTNQGMNQDRVPPLIPFNTQAILDHLGEHEEAYITEAADEDSRLHGVMRVRFRFQRPCSAPHRSIMFKLHSCSSDTLITCSCCSPGIPFAAGQGKEGPETGGPAGDACRGCI